ncbi:SRPBCC family protein [Nocardioides sp. R-C-SC26]|uniref:SRPBCC family protein n=1 Tax=Nocardioides sp. R-C-SC26 TaxID=2870414 RepID=UPI001E5CD1BE|nr:SRPBCC family protein [Nocardioides sp. R-C-SC26]
MTFEHTETATTTASPDRVWQIWNDVATWPDWDPSVADARLDGPFEAGTTGTMTLAGPIEVPLALDVVEPGRRYLDRLTMGELVIAIDHVVEATPDGSVITVSTVISGPGAEGIGPMVTAEAPAAIARLIELAQG